MILFSVTVRCLLLDSLCVLPLSLSVLRTVSDRLCLNRKVCRGIVPHRPQYSAVPIDKERAWRLLFLTSTAITTNPPNHIFMDSVFRDMARTKPNIIITGTPGVGKTTHCELLASSLGLKHLSINHIVKDRGCHDGWDEEYQSWIVDEDKVRSYSLGSMKKIFVQGLSWIVYSY